MHPTPQYRASDPKVKRCHGDVTTSSVKGCFSMGELEGAVEEGNMIFNKALEGIFCTDPYVSGSLMGSGEGYLGPQVPVPVPP